MTIESRGTVTLAAALFVLVAATDRMVAQDTCANLQAQLQMLRSSGGAGSQWEAYALGQMQELGCSGGPQATRPYTPDVPPYANQPQFEFHNTTPAVRGPDIYNNPITRAWESMGEGLMRGQPLRQDIPLSKGVPMPEGVTPPPDYVDPFAPRGPIVSVPRDADRPVGCGPGMRTVQRGDFSYCQLDPDQNLPPGDTALPPSEPERFGNNCYRDPVNYQFFCLDTFGQ